MTSATPKRASLLGLPAELRVGTFEHLFNDALLTFHVDVSPTGNASAFEDAAMRSANKAVLQTMTALSLTSHLISRESMAVFYDRLKLRLYHGTLFTPWFRVLGIHFATILSFFKSFEILSHPYEDAQRVQKWGSWDDFQTLVHIQAAIGQPVQHALCKREMQVELTSANGAPQWRLETKQYQRRVGSQTTRCKSSDAYGVTIWGRIAGRGHFAVIDVRFLENFLAVTELMEILVWNP
ncbi:hypothetical protein LTR56_010002 [Elasticomyces elasticus]|nr:hypothetical protein LTR56_010002 [Elasticomyces elasticus]KAK3665060.1 hypothetical protein LTR22_004116 [Elasticomyces elasticus]KAK4931565.1 hypothetical protein LTR49_001953 [Elasticomyces elasticus]KAK5766725.1 hypothetical protein LTS12_003074 [Elasticomyces elasticus]